MTEITEDSESDDEVPWKQYGEVRQERTPRPKLRETEGARYVFGAVASTATIIIFFILGLMGIIIPPVFTAISTIACIVTFGLILEDGRKIEDPEVPVAIMASTLFILLFITAMSLKGAVYLAWGEPNGNVFGVLWLTPIPYVVIMVLTAASVIVMLMYIRKRQRYFSKQTT